MYWLFITGRYGDFPVPNTAVQTIVFAREPLYRNEGERCEIRAQTNDVLPAVDRRCAYPESDGRNLF